MITSNSSENTAVVVGMTGSKRRSRLGLGVTPFAGSSLGIIDTNLPSTSAAGSSSVAPSNHHYQNSHYVSVIVTDFEGEIMGGQGGNVFPPLENSRKDGGRSLFDSLPFGDYVGSDGSPTDGREGWSVARRAAIILDNKSVIDSAKKSVSDESADINFDNLSREDAVRYLQTSKKYLGMRTIEDWTKFRRNLDRRKEWNKWRPTDTLLDLFTSLKYSYSSLLPDAHRKGFTSINVNDDGKTRVTKVARSHSIHLDPVDAPKELYKHRLRIDRIIDWAYKTGLVPVMMTLTVYHRWHDLEPLYQVLQKSWENLFSNCNQGLCRREHIDLRGFVRRMEVTLNDNDAEFNSGNAGWHPHYHVILLIPKNKIATLSKYEKELRVAWVDLVRKNFLKVFGEEIPATYLPSLMEHGLVISRYSKGRDKGKIRKVKDSRYLAKIMGYDPVEVYGGDKEMTAYNLKNSKVPFDLLRGDTTANKVDLWCEYAIATKGIPSFSYSYRLEKQVNDYFKAHPEKVNPEYSKLFGSEGVEIPKEKVVAYISREAYKFVYKISRRKEMCEVAKSGYDALEAWFKTIESQYGVHLGLCIWKPRDVDADDVNDDDDTSYVPVKVSEDGDAQNNESTSQSSYDIAERTESEPDLSSLSTGELYDIFGVPEDMKLTDEESDAESDTEKNFAKDTKGIEYDLDLDEAIRRGLVKVTYHKPPPKSDSSSSSSQSTDSQAENASAQGTSLPFSQEQESPSSPEPEESSAAEDLVIAEKLDRPGLLPPEVKLTPLVSQGMSLTEALEQVSLSPSQKELILGMIEHFRKEFAKEAKAKPKANGGSSQATQTTQGAAKNPEFESFKRLYNFGRLTDDAAIPESMKEELRRWYSQHEHEFGGSSP